MVVEEDTADLGLPGPSEVPSGSGVTEGGRSGARRGRGWAVIIADGRGRRGEVRLSRCLVPRRLLSLSSL